jgi:hypothetical protein
MGPNPPLPEILYGLKGKTSQILCPLNECNSQPSETSIPDSSPPPNLIYEAMKLPSFTVPERILRHGSVDQISSTYGIVDARDAEIQQKANSSYLKNTSFQCTKAKTMSSDSYYILPLRRKKGARCRLSARGHIPITGQWHYYFRVRVPHTKPNLTTGCTRQISRVIDLIWELVVWGGGWW